MMRTAFLIALVTLSVALAACVASAPPPAEAVSGPVQEVRAVAVAQLQSDPWYRQGRQSLVQALNLQPITGRARNVILFIGDGMDIGTVTAARILEGQQRGETGEENSLSFDSLPYSGLAKTYNTDMQTPDSAGTATAMLTGVKTRAGVLGVSQDVVRGNCESGRRHSVPTLLEMAEQAGLSTGVVSTAAITHATPAAGYAHTASRGWGVDSAIPEAQLPCTDIARQLVEFDHGDGLEVALGGGRAHFLPAATEDPEYAGKAGSRADGRDLTAAWRSRFGRGAHYVWNRAQLNALDGARARHVLGLFEPGQMQFEADRDVAAEPSLAEMTAKAIEILKSADTGFFLLVEGGRIDHAHHDGNAYRALTDTIAYSDAVAKALQMTDEADTLIIVTADHGHTMKQIGYPARGNPVLGLVVHTGPDGPKPAPELATDGKPYTTLVYATGPGFAENKTGPERLDLTMVDTGARDFRQPAAIPTDSETHSGEDVPVYARGPWAHLLSGTHEQNYLFHVMHYAFGFE